jgi:hypothetical protein
MPDDPKAHLEGKAAYFDGYRTTVCPYEVGTREWIEWEWGWLTAQQLEKSGYGPQNRQLGSPRDADKGQGS